MNSWHFIPWTLQYLISGSSIILISGLVLLKNRNSLAYKNFFIYGFCTAAWILMAFFHRNSPTADLSKLFFRIDVFFLLIGAGFLPLTVLFIWKENTAFYLILLPAFAVALYILITAPADIFWSKFGWSYKLASSCEKVIEVIMILYTLLFCWAFLHLSRRISSKALARKYILVFVGYLLIMVLGMVITTFFVQRKPDFPPFGGILTFLQFILIAYAVTFKPEKIIPFSEQESPENRVAISYIDFLNDFQALLPDKEPVESIFKFQDYLEAMGLEQVVTFKSNKLIFETDKLNNMILKNTPDTVINTLKQYHWASEINHKLAPIITNTYAFFYSQSAIEGKTWINKLFQNHGSFLTRYNLLHFFPKSIRIPDILNQVKQGKAIFFKEEIPFNIYNVLKKIETYGFEGLCISKLAPDNIKKKFGLQKASFLWLTFEKHKASIVPKDLNGILKFSFEFLVETNGDILVLDCLDQIKLANNFESALHILKDITSVSIKQNALLFVSISTVVFDDRELAVIRQELGEGVIEWA